MRLAQVLSREDGARRLATPEDPQAGPISHAALHWCHSREPVRPNFIKGWDKSIPTRQELRRT